MDFFTGAKIDFSTLHRFKTSLGVVLLIAAVATPILATSHVPLAEYVQDRATGAYQEPQGWELAMAIASAGAFLLAVSASFVAAWAGVKLTRDGLAGWKEVQALEDEYRKLFVTDFAARAQLTGDATNEEVDERIAREIEEEGVQESGLAGADSDSEREPAGHVTGPPGEERDPVPGAHTSGPADPEVLERARARRAGERRASDRVADLFSSTHDPRYNSYWKTPTRPQMVDLSLLPKPETAWAPLVVEVKLFATPWSALRSAERLAAVAHGIPRGQFPTGTRGRPPITNASGLLIALSTSHEEAAGVRRRIQEFNALSDTPLGVVACTHEAFYQLEDQELMRHIRSAVLSPDSPPVIG